MWTQSIDTVFIAAPASAISVAADWALVLLGSLAAVGLLVIVPALFMLRGAIRSLVKRSSELERKADPQLERGKAIGANLEFITTTLKHDVESLNGAIRGLSDRLTHASEQLEERVQDFNALIEVVQGEAEDVLLSTVATAKGMRAGASRLTSRRDQDDAAAPDDESARHSED